MSVFFNRAFDFLRGLLATARQWGGLGEQVPDACANIVPNPRRPIARYLDAAEFRRLARCSTGTPGNARGRSRPYGC